jgi:Holliday junction resolvase
LEQQQQRTKIEIGDDGEKLGIQIMESRGFSVKGHESRGDAHDLIAEKNGQTFLINVKYTLSGHWGIDSNNVKRLLTDGRGIPAFLFISQDLGSSLFTLSDFKFQDPIYSKRNFVWAEPNQKIKKAFDEFVFELGTTWNDIISEALCRFLPELEKRAEIVKRKNLRNPMDALPH